MTSTGRHMLLVLLLLATVVAGSAEVLGRSRGASSPEELIARYLESMSRADAAAVAWLMDREDPEGITTRVAMYRRISGDVGVVIERTEHPNASYIKGARISDGRQLFDEIGMQHFGSRFGDRWRLFFPPAASR